MLFDLPRSTSQGFPDFWAIYPRHVARIAAERAWKQAVKIEAPEKIIAAARAYAFQCGNDPRFILHASTFLNQQRWEDYRPLDHEKVMTDRERWEIRLKDYKPGGYWPDSGIWGPRPESGECEAPGDLIAQALNGTAPLKPIAG